MKGLRGMVQHLKALGWRLADRGGPHVAVEDDPKLQRMERQSDALKLRVEQMERMLQAERDWRNIQRRER